MRSATAVALLLLSLAAGAGCATSRGPVDRSVDAAHATNRTIGETVDAATDAPKEPGNSFAGVVTAPFRLVGRLGEALFGP